MDGLVEQEQLIVLELLLLDFLDQQLVVVDHLRRYRSTRHIPLRLVEGGHFIERLIKLSLVDLAFIDQLVAERSEQSCRVPGILPMSIGRRTELLHEVAKVHGDEDIEDLSGQLVEVIDALLIVVPLLSARLESLVSTLDLADKVRIHVDDMRQILHLR